MVEIGCSAESPGFSGVELVDHQGESFRVTLIRAFPPRRLDSFAARAGSPNIEGERPRVTRSSSWPRSRGDSFVSLRFGERQVLVPFASSRLR
jgi:hypothetical protein